MRALLIVDVQNDFLPGGTLPVPDGDRIIPEINRLQKEFDLVVATKDWHPENHVSFADSHVGKKPGECVIVKGVEQKLWPIHCVQGTWGAEFSPLLETQKIAKVFHKGIDPEIDSYSTFFDNIHARSTGLEKYLKDRGVDEITICGLATDYCVRYSVFDALELGFAVNVALEACKGINLQEGDVERAILDMEQTGAVILPK